MIQENVKCWFPLRIKYASGERFYEIGKRLADETSVDEIYIPTAFMKVSDTKMDFAPMLSNILFIRTTLASLRVIKANKGKYERIRYIMHPAYDENYDSHTEIVHVSDRTMTNIKKIISNANEQVVFLHNMKYASKPGQLVQITEGPFAGVIGTVKSFKKHLCVVVPIEEVGAFAVTYIPKKHLLYLKDGQAY
jgi:hypothetical protein